MKTGTTDYTYRDKVW